jgi:hypothetical protein
MQNLRQARWDRREIAGAFGDMGTFLPLLTGLSMQCGLDFGTGLFFAGLANVVTGLSFGIPMAVQPMKAIAAVALTQGLGPGQIVVAGVMVSLVVLGLGLSGLLAKVQAAVPMTVIRGLQLGLGLALLSSGLKMAASGAEAAWVAGLGAFLACLLMGSARLPSALLLFALGLVGALWRAPSLPPLALWWPTLHLPLRADLGGTFFKAALPQLPLTVLNSVVAVCALSCELYPSRPAEPRKVALSVGLMNLVGAPFGAMPLCHGAGGLAAQHRFGARSNGSILFLGALKMALALAFGTALAPLLRAFPSGILAVLLAFSGFELASTARSLRGSDEYFVALVTATACVALNDPALGLALGLAGHHLIRRGWLRLDGVAPLAAGSEP